jgi:hypothetical protein
MDVGGGAVSLMVLVLLLLVDTRSEWQAESIAD